MRTHDAAICDVGALSLGGVARANVAHVQNVETYRQPSEAWAWRKVPRAPGHSNT